MSVALRVAAPSLAFRKISSPRFVIGQDEQGHWVALDAAGREGGLFASREAALKYVAAETGRRRPTAMLAAKPLALWK
jgi:hypothetical protein